MTLIIDPKEVQRRREISPEEPWRWNPDWDSGQMEFSFAGGIVPIVWGVAIFWNLIVIMFGWMFIAGNDLRKELYITVFLSVFLAVGLFLVYKAIRATLMQRKYGRSSFQMNGVPAFFGGRVESTIVTSSNLPGTQPILLKLECENHDPFQKTRSALWSKQQEVLHTGVRTIPVCFDIPDDQPESRFLRENGKAYINWNLSARMKAKGIDYLAVFEVPVFRRRQSV